jgi:hypothetical protein
MEEVQRFVGIDVAKAALDVCIGSDGTAFSLVNDEVAIRQLLLVNRVAKVHPKPIYAHQRYDRETKNIQPKDCSLVALIQVIVACSQIEVSGKQFLAGALVEFIEPFSMFPLCVCSRIH